MKVIVCEPNIPPYVTSILGNYENLKEIIGNEVKAIATTFPSIVVLCDLERYQTEAHIAENRMNIPGTFLFAGRDNDRLRSLNDEEINEIFNTVRKEDLTVVH